MPQRLPRSPAPVHGFFHRWLGTIRGQFNYPFNDGFSSSLSLWSVLTTPSETYFRSGPMSYAIEWSHICEATRKEKRERETNKMEGLERKEETEREGGKMDPLQEMVSWETRGKPINAKMDASSSSFHSCILHSTRAFGVYTHPFLLCISLPPLRCSLYSSCS